MELLNVSKAHIKMSGLLNTLKFVYTMYTDIIQFVCSSGELVHLMPRL